MAVHSSPDNQELHDQLEKAKETLGRLRCINGFTQTCSTSTNKVQGCWRHAYNVPAENSSHRCGKYSRAGSSQNWKDEELREVRNKSMNSRSSRLDLKRLQEQISGLEDSVRKPILSYIDKLERQHIDMMDSVETIQRQFHNHERMCPAMNVSSGNRRNRSDAWVNGSEKEILDLRGELHVSQQDGRESRLRAESLEKEVEFYRGKLERSEARMKDLFRSVTQRQSLNPASSNEVLLENQLRQYQQLTEVYFKESTSKDREVNFLTIEKYNLESEVNSLVGDLEASNLKRDEVLQEKKRLETKLMEYRQSGDRLQQQLQEIRAENKRLNTQFRGVLDEERARSDKNSENLSFQEKQIKELRKKCKKYEEHRNSQKDVAQRLAVEREELLTKVRNLSNEYATTISECDCLREENQRLSKEISRVQLEASRSMSECNNSRVYSQSLRDELREASDTIKVLECSLQACKVNESKFRTEIAAFSNNEASLKDQIETSEKERLMMAQELKEMKKHEVALKNGIKQMNEKVEASQKEAKQLSERCSSFKTDLELSRQKYFQIKQTNDELVLNNNDLERSQHSKNEEVERLKASYDHLSERNGQLCADLKAYKRIAVEKENQLKEVELQLAQFHKAKDIEFNEFLKKDREVSFLKARVLSTERNGIRSMRDNVRETESIRSATSSSNDPGKEANDIEVYVERIVELESESKAQKMQIDQLRENLVRTQKVAQRSDSLMQEVARQDEEIHKLRREVSRSNQVVEDLQNKEEKLNSLKEEKENLRQEVVQLQAKVQEVSEFQQVCEQKEEELRALRRTSSEEVDLEGKVSRLKDRCREKDEEIEELHQKVISLQVKIKDFIQQNSQVEEQVRNLKDKHSIELSEKEKISQALKTAETKCWGLEQDLQGVKSRSVTLEKDLVNTRHQVDDLQSDKEGSALKIADLMAENKRKETKIEELREQVQDLEKTKYVEEKVRSSVDLPDGGCTPLDTSLENSRLSPTRGGRTSALDRLEVLEEENIQLLNKQSELEEELDAAEEHIHELKNTLKAKRENVNELHGQLDILKERLKVVEKAKGEMAEENELLQQTYLLLEQKIEDMKATSERHMNESDELEKALTAAETKIEELEKRLEEVSGKCASGEGQLQSVTERLARKEKELEVVETHVEEQRKLCDGYKESVEKQETIVEKLRVEKATAEETFLAMKLEVAKKEGTYKAGKEKVTEFQTRLYETEDRLTSKVNECKKLNRENERLKRGIKELENKLSEPQTTKKKTTTSEAEKSSIVYNTKFQSLNTSVKDNSQNVEGLDTKLNSAQSKISTLEVELANDLRKFSLHRTTSDIPRRGYSSYENQLSPSSPSLKRPRSYSNLTADTTDSREDLRSVSPVLRAGSSASFTGQVESLETKAEKPISSIPQVLVSNLTEFSVSKVSENQEDAKHGEGSHGTSGDGKYRANSFLGEMEQSLVRADGFSDQIEESFRSPTSESLVHEASSTLRRTSTEESEIVVQEAEGHVQETITSTSAVVTGALTLTTSLYSPEKTWNEEELIYF